MGRPRKEVDPEVSETTEELNTEPGTGVSVITPLVVNVPVVIPDVLNINGVEVSEDLIKEKVAEIKKMKVDGPFDQEGIDKLAEARKRVLRLRTGSEAWRKSFVKPVADFTSALKKKIDFFGSLCAEGEQAADDIMKPVNEELERLRTEKARKAEEEFKRRVDLIIANGGTTTDGTGYNFSHDTNLFINAVILKEMEPDEWEAEFADIKASWEVESARLQKIEDDKLAEQDSMRAQLAALNETRTRLRKKELKFEGFIATEPGVWTAEDDRIITETQVLSLSDDDWDAALIQTSEEEIPEPEAKSPLSFNFGGFGASTNKLQQEEPEAIDLGADFADENEEVQGIDWDEEIQPEEELSEKAPYTRSFVFSESKPFVQFEAIPGKFDQIIFPNELVEWATVDIIKENILSSGPINEQLSFIIFKK